MSRFLVLLTLLGLVGCDRPPASPKREPAAPSAASFDNESAAQSIVRPEVIAEVEPAPAAAGGEDTKPPRSITIAFPSGASLDDTGKAALDEMLVTSKPLPAVSYVLRGHSDSTGSDRDNLRTSRRRAEAVRDYLVEQGIPATSISVIAIGEGRPVAPNTTDNGQPDQVGQARNRRVDVEIIVPAAATPAPTPAEQ